MNRALLAHLDAIETRLHARLDAMEVALSARFDTLYGSIADLRNDFQRHVENGHTHGETE